LGNRYFSDPLEDALEESQEVVDSFFNSCSVKKSNNNSNELDEVVESSSSTSETVSTIDLVVYEGRKKSAQNIHENNW
jgi:hypothetical protein